MFVAFRWKDKNITIKPFEAFNCKQSGRDMINSLRGKRSTKIRLLVNEMENHFAHMKQWEDMGECLPKDPFATPETSEMIAKAKVMVAWCAVLYALFQLEYFDGEDVHNGIFTVEIIGDNIEDLFCGALLPVFG
jgi:hypothetical protein